MADNQQKSPEQRMQDAADASKVKAIQAEELGLANILRLKLQSREADKQSQKIGEAMKKLSQDQVKQIKEYEGRQKAIQTYEQNLLKYKGKQDQHSKSMVTFAEAEIQRLQKKQTLLQKTEAVALSNLKKEADITAQSLKTEKKLVQDINSQRGLGAKVMDLFRSKERQQLSVDIARARAGGGVQVTTSGAGGGKGGGPTAATTTGASALGPEVAAIVAAAKAAAAPIKELGNQIKNGLMAPLASAANLLTGEDYGMGGGKANASGATSILGGLSSILKTIPLVGGVLGGLVDGFKAIADAMLGINQANFRVARTLNISVDEAARMRKQFDGIAMSSDNIVVNSTRMLQSQIEISKQLGTNKQLSADILVNDVKLRDVLGLEAESRQQIAEASIVTGRNATKLTQAVIGTVGAFNKLVGTSFKFNDIIGEASKLSGVMGLTFAKYPEKITKAILSVKTLGFDLKQLDSTAESFLDFESSISKEMEAQVLTGKDMNLTAAREAALNNDNAKLAQEITKNVGDANAYLKLNRIQQEAIAQSVGMSRDSLADVLKKQELYSKLGATDVATFNKKIELLEKQGKTQQQISDLIGKDAYNTYTQVSTAEKLTEVMERIKKVFVDFIKNTGIFDFLTNPAKMDGFIKGLADKLASTVSMIGGIIAAILRGLSHLPGFDKEVFQGYAAQIEAGSSNFAGTIRSTAGSLGGALAPSLSGTVQQGSKQANTSAAAPTSATQSNNNQPIQLVVYTTVDGEVIAKSSTRHTPTVYGQNTR